MFKLGIFTNFKACFSPVLMDFSLTGLDQKLKKNNMEGSIKINNLLYNASLVLASFPF